MLDLEKMKVSLTKNGYMKLADVIRLHPSTEILNNIRGTYRGINLIRSQVSKVLSVDPDSGEVPVLWDEIHALGDSMIDGCTFIAIILSHRKLIEVLAKSQDEIYRGAVSRDDLSNKEYTNLVYAMACLNLCDYERGSVETEYDFHPLVANLQGKNGLTVKKLIALKLKRCGWVDPSSSPLSGDREFFAECHSLGLPEVFSMDPDQFDAWMRGELSLAMPGREFGLNRNRASRIKR